MFGLRAPLVLAGLQVLVGCHAAPPASSVPAFAPSQLLGSSATPEGVELTTSTGVWRISAPRADTFRIHLAETRETPALASFAIEPEALGPGVPLEVTDRGATLLIRSAEAALSVHKHPLRVSLLDRAGGLVTGDALQAAFREPGVSLRFELSDDEHVYGLGDKVKGFDRRGQAFELRNTDAFGWKVNADPLYKSLPFFMFLRQRFQDQRQLVS